MLFNGLKIQRILKSSLLLFVFIFSSSLIADDDSQLGVPGQFSDKEYEENLHHAAVEREDPDSSYVMGNSEPEKYLKDVKSSGFGAPGAGLQEDMPSPSQREKLISVGMDAPQSMENRENLLTYDGDDVYKEIYDRGDSSFSFSYFRDQYSVSDSGGVFQQSYVDAKGARRGGYLHFNFDSYLNRSFLSSFYGVGLGVGFSEGVGVFSQSTTDQSNVKFQLFMIPADFRLGLTIGRGKYFRLSVAGGPSAMGLAQSRNDKNNGDPDQHKRQVSLGYFGHAKVQVSLSALFHDVAFAGFSQYQMTNMYLNLEARHQSYSHFQDDVTIKGTSFGIGFTFEYL